MIPGETAWTQLERAIAKLEAEQLRLRNSVNTYQSTIGELHASVTAIEHNLGRYHDTLETVRLGTTKLGAKSRKLAAIMDTYLVRHGGAVATPAADLPAALSRAA